MVTMPMPMIMVHIYSYSVLFHKGWLSRGKKKNATCIASISMSNNDPHSNYTIKRNYFIIQTQLNCISDDYAALQLHHDISILSKNCSGGALSRSA